MQYEKKCLVEFYSMSVQCEVKSKCKTVIQRKFCTGLVYWITSSGFQYNFLISLGSMVDFTCLPYKKGASWEWVTLWEPFSRWHLNQSIQRHCHKQICLFHLISQGWMLNVDNIILLTLSGYSKRGYEANK